MIADDVRTVAHTDDPHHDHRRHRAGRQPRSLPAVLVLLALLVGVAGCSTATAATATTATTAVSAQVGFGFEIDDLRTDHQFPGQTSTFHVSYEYRPGLQGAGFDPAGHSVADNTYPYFQDIRDDMVSLVQSYPDKSDFYEVFLGKVGNDLMAKYPQLASLDIRIDVPAFGGVPTARFGTVHLTRS